jgi:hypothetical protein
MATGYDLWTYRAESGLGDSSVQRDMIGFGVEALDGSIGKIDEATYEVSSSYVVVDTGPWIFGCRPASSTGSTSMMKRCMSTE